MRYLARHAASTAGHYANISVPAAARRVAARRSLSIILLGTALTVLATRNALAEATGTTVEESRASDVTEWAYGLATIPFFVRDILWVRILASTTALLVLGLAVLGVAPPTPALLLSMAVVLLVNAVRMAQFAWERARVGFSAEERALHDTVFPQFSDVEFMRVLKASLWRSAGAGAVIARQGEELDELIVIADGYAEIERDATTVAELGTGAVIGEISYLQGGEATATVRAGTPVRYLAIPHSRLAKLLRKHPPMKDAMTSALSLGLIRKITARNGTSPMSASDAAPYPELRSTLTANT